MSNQIKLFFIGLFVSVLTLYSISFAQGKAGKSGGGMGYFAVGMNLFNLNTLNSRLTEHGYPEFSGHLLSIGGGGHAIVGKLVIGGEGQGLSGEEKSVRVNSQPFKSSLSGGFGLFDLGYLVYSKNGLNLYPLLGIGGGGITLKIAEDSSPSFDDVLSHPNRSVELIYGGFVFNLSLGVDYFIKMAQEEEGFGGFVLGLRAGYMLTPFTHNWKMDEHDIGSGPDVGLNGFFIRMTLGGGGMGKKK